MRTCFVVLAALGLLAFTGFAHAQASAKAAQFLQVTTLTLRPAAVTDYEDVTKKINAARDKLPGRNECSPTPSPWADPA